MTDFKKTDKLSSKHKGEHKPSQVVAPPKPTPKPTTTLTPMEKRLLQDIASHLRSIKSARYATVIPLDHWLRNHNYPQDFVDAAVKAI